MHYTLFNLIAVLFSFYKYTYRFLRKYSQKYDSDYNECILRVYICGE